MRVCVGLAVVSIFLVHCGGTWAYAFFVILKHGEVTFYEPSLLCLVVEFVFATILTLLGLVFLGVAIWEMRRRTEGK